MLVIQKRAREVSCSGAPPEHAPSMSAETATSPTGDGGTVLGKVPVGPPFLSLRDAAEWLGASLSTVKRLIARGELTAVYVGKRRKIPAALLTAYISRDMSHPEQYSE